MPPAFPFQGHPSYSGRDDLADQGQCPVLERLGPDQGPVEPGLPGAGVAYVIEVLACGLHQPVGGVGDRLLFQSTPTEQVAGTAYGLIQAAGEYLDHVRTARTWETRLNRTLMRPEPLKHRALTLVREITAA